MGMTNQNDKKISELKIVTYQVNLSQMLEYISTKFFQVLPKYLGTLQSLTGKYREIQGKPCNENRDPAMRTGFPCIESRFFSVGIDLQGKAVSCTGFGFTV